MPRLPLALLLLASVIVLVPSSPRSAADERDRLKVGLQPDGRIVVPTNQILQPAGTQVTFPGRPVDLLLDRRRADARRQEHAEPRVHRRGHRRDRADARAAGRGEGAVRRVQRGRAGRGRATACSPPTRRTRSASRTPEGRRHVRLGRAIPAEGRRPSAARRTRPGWPSRATSDLWVCSSRGNELQLLNLDDGEVEARVPVGVAPYMPVVVGEKVYVSQLGRRPPGQGRPAAQDLRHAGQDRPAHERRQPRQRLGRGEGRRRVEADEEHRGRRPPERHDRQQERQVRLRRQRQQRHRQRHRHGEGRGGRDDRLQAGGEAAVRHRVERRRAESGRPHARTSPTEPATASRSSSSAAKSTEARRPWLPRSSRTTGLIPTGWYPGAVRLSADGKRLFVANVKGHGSLQPRKVEPPAKKAGKGDGDDPAAPQKKGKNSHDHLGSVSLIDVPDAAALKKYTRDGERQQPARLLARRAWRSRGRTRSRCRFRSGTASRRCSSTSSTSSRRTAPTTRCSAT